MIQNAILEGGKTTNKKEREKQKKKKKGKVLCVGVREMLFP